MRIGEDLEEVGLFVIAALAGSLGDNPSFSLAKAYQRHPPWSNVSPNMHKRTLNRRPSYSISVYTHGSVKTHAARVVKTPAAGGTRSHSKY